MKIIKKILIYIVLIGLGLLAIAPFVWTLHTAFILEDLNINKGLLSPDKYGFANFVYIFTHSLVFRWTINSIVTTLIITVANLLFNSMAGYALARYEFRGKKIIFFYVLGTMMIPTQIIMIPIYLQISRFGMVDSYAGLIVPFLINPFGVFLMRQFYLGFTKEIEEAGKMDGLSNLGVFFQIALPLAKSAILTQAIFIFVWNWNSFTLPSIIVQSQEKFTLPLGIYQITNSQYIASVTKAMAATLITLLPTIVLYVVFQKYLVGSHVSSAVK